METLRGKKGFICDMDGVIYHGNRLLPGVKEFVAWLYRENKNFLFLTNSSEHSPKELQRKLERMGLEVDESHFYTSALATARFISSQAPGCSAYVIGGAGLIMALHDEGITMNDIDPDYVIIGEGNTYNYENILRAVHLVLKGAKLIGTNSDQSADDAHGAAHPGRALRRGCDDRRPHGHRHGGGHRNGPRHRAGALRRDCPRGHPQIPLSSAPGAGRRRRYSAERIRTQKQLKRMGCLFVCAQKAAGLASLQIRRLFL